MATSPNALIQAVALSLAFFLRGWTTTRARILFARRETPARLYLTAWFVTLVLALMAAEVQASAGGKARTVEQLQLVLRQGDFIPRAFLKGDQLRLHFTRADRSLAFKADWDRPRFKSPGFNSHLAELKFDASPPTWTGSQTKWHEAKVLAFGEWQHFARSALEALTPAEAGHGLYLQYFLGDALLFRDVSGEIRANPLAAVPEGIIIDRRLGQAESTVVLAEAMKANLQAAYPRHSAFVLTPSAGAPNMRLVLLDLAARRVVVLWTPRLDEERLGGIPLSAQVSWLAAFALLDHAWAILKNPVSVSGRLVNLGLQWPASLLNPQLRTRASIVPGLAGGPGMNLDAWEQWLDAHTGTVRERGSVRLLINGEQFFPVFEGRLEQAAQSIDLEVCIFDRDDVAVRLADQLKQRSTQVPVRVILDHNSSRAAGQSPPATPMAVGFVPPKSISRYLTAGSRVNLRWYLNPLMTSDHTKVFLIDGRYVYLGGMNFGREYRYEWHDLMAEIEGPVVSSFQHEFNKNWALAGPLGDLAFAQQILCGNRPQVAVADRGDFIDLRRMYTKTGRPQIRRAVLAGIRRAQNHVYLENPYLFDNAVVVALVKARLRGVDVRVILPSENDLSPGAGSNLVTANYLLKHGVRVYFYPGMTHVKALLADGWTCFGSANFNTLSLRLNQEANLATSDPGFAARFKQELFDLDFEKSYELKEPVSVGWSDHLADTILNPF